jgi:hypothetical protein
MRRLPRVVAISGAALALAGSAFAADQIAGRDRAPAAATVTIDSTAPLFSEAGLVNGQQFERCTVITNQGPQPADVTLFGTASQADLSPWLDLDLVRGTLPAGTAPGDCTGFAADAVDYGTGTNGVVFHGTLASLPGDDAGIADPTRWAVGEQHAYLLRVHYTGDDPQQGLSTTQSFSWGATPFDDRGPDPLQASGTTPEGGGIVGIAGGETGDPGTPVARQCKIVSFPTRSYIGARAISRPTQIKKKTSKKAAKAELSALGTSDDTVIAAGEDPAAVGPSELAHRAELLRATKASARASARRTPVLVVRLAPTKDATLAVRVGLRKNGVLSSPKRWRWVRVRLNQSSTKSTLKWPFTATAQMTQLKLGYNQLDLTLNRGVVNQRVKGLPRLMRRSFAFVVGLPTEGSTGSDCTLG